MVTLQTRSSETDSGDHYGERVAIEPIEHSSDARLDDFRSLNDTARQRSLERPGPFGPGRLIIEGTTALSNAVGGRHAIRRVLCRHSRAAEVTDIVGERVPVLSADPDLIDEVVGFPLHRGVVASAERGRDIPWPDVATRTARALVIEAVNDGENMGSLCRTARALRADSVLIDPTAIDPLVRRSMRVSLGHAARLSIARAPLAELFGHWRSTPSPPTRVVALSPQGDTSVRDLRPADPTERVVVAVGAEGPGLSAATLELCDVVASIPMAHDVDSLNVAAAAAIALHHLFGSG